MPRFVPRERKHKRLTKQAAADTNAAEIIPLSVSEKEAKRLALSQDLREQQPQSKISSKKKKRLDKYIDTKLRKEENAELLRKLADQKVDTSSFRSSKTIGQKPNGKRVKLQHTVKPESVSSSDESVESSERVLFEPRRNEREQEPDNESSDEDERTEEVGAAQPPQIVNGVAVAMLGSGLKRPLELDEDGKPLIRKKKRRKHQHLVHGSPSEAGVESNEDLPEGVSDDEEWHGFSESDQDFAMGSETASEHSSNETNEPEPPESSSDGNSPAQDKRTRTSAFKAWADSLRNSAIGFTPSSANMNDNIVDAKIKANFKPRPLSPDLNIESVPFTSSAMADKFSSAITLPRSDETQKSRLELPVVQEEQKIMETINANAVTIICGATGSGKTTQVPQMLFENGYGSSIGTASTESYTRGKGMVGITQPRRVAATSVAERVAYELGSGYSNRIAHQVRYDTNVSKATAIKYMTDGVLLRETQTDFTLSKYSCIIIDEAHERSVNTDILIGMLSRIVPLRAELAAEEPGKYYPLKLIIMSATLRVNDFLHNQRLFKDLQPPVVEVEGRQYTVTEHFARRTKRDYVAEMIDKVARGHRKLPPGGMLVFLTGQQEILSAASRLKETLGGSKEAWKVDRGGGDFEDFEDFLEIGGEDEYLEGEETFKDNESDAEVQIGNEVDDEFDVHDDDPCRPMGKGALKPHILPLYAALPALQQQKVFRPTPDGHRMIILATNVAETSLTIPGIRYVFDSGRAKEKKYDQRTGVQSFEVDWISKASAAQRKGRAGRTGPGGHVWRLYSSAVYEQYFEDHSEPEILRTPLETVVLQLKGLEIENVANFPYPTAPDAKQLLVAERLLRNLGALAGEKITQSGKEMMRFPVSPRFGKILMLAKQNKVLPHALALVAGLVVGDLYTPESQSLHEEESGSESGVDGEKEKQHRAYTRAQATLSRWDDRSDAIKVLTAVAAHTDALRTSTEEAKKLCRDFWLREKGMNEVQQLRRQLQSILSSQSNAAFESFDISLTLPTGKDITMLNQVLAAGFIDQVAIRADLLKDEALAYGRKPRRAIEMAYRTLIPTTSTEDLSNGLTPEEREIEKSVFIHPSSVLAKLSTTEMPQYLVYSHLSRASTTTIDGRRKRTRIHPLTAIGPKVLAVLAEGSPLFDIGRPIGKIEELPDRRRQCWIGISIRAPEVGGIGWPLAQWKVIQKRVTRGEWTIEKVLAR